MAAAALGSENWPKTHFRAETIECDLTNSRPPYAGVWPQTTSRPNYLPWASLPTEKYQENLNKNTNDYDYDISTITDTERNLPQVDVVDLIEYSSELATWLCRR